MTYGQQIGYPSALADGPSGGAAITAATLALLCLPWTCWGSYQNIDFLLGGAEYPYSLTLILHLVVCLLELATFATGAVLLFLRNAAGRWLVAAGAGLTILQAVVSVVLFSLMMGEFTERNGAITYLVAGPLMILPAVPALVLVVHPSTGGWCLRRRS